MSRTVLIFKTALRDYFSEKHNIYTYFVVILLYELVYIVFLRVLFLNVATIRGFGFYELLSIFGFFQIVFSLFHIMFAYFIWFQNKYLWRRGLDTVLILPVHPLYYITLKEIPGQIMEITSLFIGIIIFIIGIIHVKLNVMKTLLLLPFVLSLSFSTLTGFSLILVSFGFLVYGRKGPFEVFYDIMELAQYPINIFPKVLRILFTYVFPLFQFATLPYFNLKNISLSGMLLLSISGVLFPILGLMLFSRSLKKYRSGGG